MIQGIRLTWSIANHTITIADALLRRVIKEALHEKTSVNASGSGFPFPLCGQPQPPAGNPRPMRRHWHPQPQHQKLTLEQRITARALLIQMFIETNSS